MSEITDDFGNSIETGIPLYDLKIGEFVRLEVDDETIEEINVISGDSVYEGSLDMFIEEGWFEEYRKISEYVVESPNRVLEEVLHAVLSDDFDNFAGYEPWEVKFAWFACNFEPTELK
jgi:hypothetical protein